MPQDDDTTQDGEAVDEIEVDGELAVTTPEDEVDEELGPDEGLDEDDVDPEFAPEDESEIATAEAEKEVQAELGEGWEEVEDDSEVTE